MSFRLHCFDFGEIIVNNFIRLMDPRPYNYEFRRPRPNNPTYQSYNAYESLYHMGKKEGRSPNTFMHEEHMKRSNLYSPNYPNISQNYMYEYSQQRPRESSERVQRANGQRYEEIGVNTDKKESRSSSNYSQRSKSSALSNVPSNPNPLTHRTSVLSTYGSSSLEKKDIEPISVKKDSLNIVFAHNDTSQIFKKQQRPFNIINMYSRQNEPLRKYPKLTKEHLLYEQGMGFAE